MSKSKKAAEAKVAKVVVNGLSNGNGQALIDAKAAVAAATAAIVKARAEAKAAGLEAKKAKAKLKALAVAKYTRLSSILDALKEQGLEAEMKVI